MSVNQIVSADLAVLATDNRRAVPSVDAVFRKAGIGQDALPTSAALVSMALPNSAAVLAMAQASRRVGRAAVGMGCSPPGSDGRRDGQVAARHRRHRDGGPRQ